MVKIDLTSPRATLETLHRASAARDAIGYLAAIEPGIAGVMKMLVAPSAQLRAKATAVAALVARKIGPAEAAVVRRLAEDNMVGPSPLANALHSGTIDWSAVTITQRDDKATVAVAGALLPITLRRIDGKWYAVPPAGQTGGPAAVRPDVNRAAQSIREWTENLGKFEQRVRGGLVTPENFQREFDATIYGVGTN